jgi:hypothetical protein
MNWHSDFCSLPFIGNGDHVETLDTWKLGGLILKKGWVVRQAGQPLQSEMKPQVYGTFASKPA